MYHIKKQFCKRFALWKMEIKEEDVFVGNKINLVNDEWHMKCIVSEDNKGVFLEFYGIHKRQGHVHERIYEDGRGEKLEVLQEYIAYTPSIPGDRERKAREFERYNHHLMTELKGKGLF